MSEGKELNHVTGDDSERGMEDTGQKPVTWLLKLYVAGQTPRSLAAFSNLKSICDTHLSGNYSIEVIDLLENPQLAEGDQIIAIPTLIRKLPEPVRRLIGDLSNTERVLVGLNIVPKKDSL